MNAALNMKQLQRKHYNLIVQAAVKDMKRSWKKICNKRYEKYLQMYG